MQLVRTSPFTNSIAKLKVTEAELADLETEIATNPQAGDVIQGLKGVRKIRFAMGGKGKRGGAILSGAGNRGHDLSVVGLWQVKAD